MSEVQGSFTANSASERGDGVGYRTSVVVKTTGLTKRQIDYWARTGFFEPSLNDAQGSGNHRLYTFKDILILKTYKRLLDTGVHISKIKKAKMLLKSSGILDLSSVTLISDGNSIFLARSNEDIINLLQSGQGVFAVSLQSIWSETEAHLVDFKAVTVEEESMTARLENYKNDLIERGIIPRGASK
ncbi:MAG: MerR family transcriptional regulator [Candidatus Ancillula sp.]|jgi:DNA-binding transcriptional MerR regulator|nr:MerR family transcriptional regulator [Candidatus Ancillula sp.]